MARENVAGHRLQVLIAVGRVVSGGGSGPKPREDFGGENLFQHGTNARPGKRRGTQGLIGGGRQLPEQATPAVEAAF